jgi:cytoskeletal protein RodZ
MQSKSKMGSNRWFIWALVFVVVVGVGLVTYITYAGTSLSNQAVPSFVVHHVKAAPKQKK